MTIELPKDAEGKAIPLDTQVLYRGNGEHVSVSHFLFNPRSHQPYWTIETIERGMSNPKYLYLTKPDTLEQLAADLDRVAYDSESAACAYLNRDKGTCIGCKFQKISWDKSGFRNCTKPFLLDVAARVHRLAGDDK